MSRERKTAEVKIEQEEHTPPFVIEKHPVDGVPIMLRDPNLIEVRHQQTTVACTTADSFAFPSNMATKLPVSAPFFARRFCAQRYPIG